jgi:hypothetical protein
MSLCLINSALRHENIGGSGGIAPSFLASALQRGEWSASRPSLFTSWEIDSGTNRIAGQDAVEKGKFYHAGNRTRVIQSVTRRYTD